MKKIILLLAVIFSLSACSLKVDESAENLNVDENLNPELNEEPVINVTGNSLEKTAEPVPALTDNEKQNIEEAFNQDLLFSSLIDLNEILRRQFFLQPDMYCLRLSGGSPVDDNGQVMDTNEFFQSDKYIIDEVPDKYAEYLHTPLYEKESFYGVHDYFVYLSDLNYLKEKYKGYLGNSYIGGNLQNLTALANSILYRCSLLKNMTMRNDIIDLASKLSGPTFSYRSYLVSNRWSLIKALYASKIRNAPAEFCRVLAEDSEQGKYYLDFVNGFTQARQTYFEPRKTNDFIDGSLKGYEFLQTYIDEKCDALNYPSVPGIELNLNTASETVEADTNRLTYARKLSTALELEAASAYDDHQPVPGCTLPYSSTLTCNLFTDSLKGIFQKTQDPSASSEVCRPGSDSPCIFSISSADGTAGARYNDYQICFYLEAGVGNLQAGLNAVKNGGQWGECR